MEILSINWSNAFVVLGLGVGIVFAVLVMLVFLLNAFGWFFIRKEKPVAVISIVEVNIPSGAEKAAIAMALYLFYQDEHNEESGIITIKGNPTSWNSKVYGLNNLIK